MAVHKINLPDGKSLETKTKKGRNLITKCPYHEEETPSFFVNYESGDYQCLGCGVKGTGAEVGYLTETLEEHTQAFWEESQNEKSLFEKTTGEYKAEKTFKKSETPLSKILPLIEASKEVAEHLRAVAADYHEGLRETALESRLAVYLEKAIKIAESE